jgi:cystathionine beta-synthase
MLRVEREEVSVRDVASSLGPSELILASPDDRIVDVIKRMRDDAISQLPVIDDEGLLLGLVSEVDLLTHMLTVDHDHAPDETIETMINRDVPRANASQLFEQVIPDLMQTKTVILTDDRGRPESILTIIDALEYVTRKELM